MRMAGGFDCSATNNWPAVSNRMRGSSGFDSVAAASTAAAEGPSRQQARKNANAAAHGAATHRVLELSRHLGKVRACISWPRCGDARRDQYTLVNMAAPSTSRVTRTGFDWPIHDGPEPPAYRCVICFT